MARKNQYRLRTYRAANWALLGRTTGRGKQSNSYVPNRSIKEVLGYPLTPKFRELVAAVGVTLLFVCTKFVRQLCFGRHACEGVSGDLFIQSTAPGLGCQRSSRTGQFRVC